MGILLNRAPRQLNLFALKITRSARSRPLRGPLSNKTERKRKEYTFLLHLLENEPDRALPALARSALEQKLQNCKKAPKNHEIQNFSKSWTFWTLRKFRPLLSLSRKFDEKGELRRGACARSDRFGTISRFDE